MQHTCSRVHRSLRPAPLSSDGSCSPARPGDTQHVLVVLVPWHIFSWWVYSGFGLVLELGAAKAKSWDSAGCPLVTWEEVSSWEGLRFASVRLFLNQKYPLHQHHGLEVGRRKTPQVAHPVFCWIFICRACAVLNKANDIKLGLF